MYYLKCISEFLYVLFHSGLPNLGAESGSKIIHISTCTAWEKKKRKEAKRDPF